MRDRREEVSHLFMKTQRERTTEWNEKISRALKGQKKTIKHCLAMSKGREGITLSKNHRKNISISLSKSYEEGRRCRALQNLTSGDNQRRIRICRLPLARMRRSIVRNDMIEWKTFGLEYTTIQLKNHLEKQFKPGMSWKNYGEWVIDHIRSIGKYPLDTPIHVVNALSNLQPLWKIDNWKKNWKEIT